MTQHAEIKRDIALSLGFDPDRPPLTVDPRDAAKALGLKPTTLSVWRCTGRVILPYSRAGRMIRYRLDDLAAFVIARTQTHV